MKEIYLVEKINQKTKDVTYHFGAYSQYSEANRVCNELNENLSGTVYVVESVNFED